MRSKAMLGAMVIVVLSVGCSKDQTTTAGSPTTTAAAGGTTTTKAPAGTTTAKPTTTVASAPGAVTIADYQFAPENRTAKVGETITWTNTDEFAHYVKSDEGIELDSGSMEKSGTYTHAFTKAGTYAYHCEIHNIMKGTVTVS